jgi:hypothetical protein
MQPRPYTTRNSKRRPAHQPEKNSKGRTQRFGKHEGIDFVRCRICGDHRRVISGRHLSKHGIDRETYMAEYRLSPDELCAKEFRSLRVIICRRCFLIRSSWTSAA